MRQIDKFYSDIFSAPPGWPTLFGNPIAQIYHAMQSIQHQVWRKLGEIRVFVLDIKCNPLLPPYQFKEVFLNIISLVLCWPLFFPPPKNTLIIMLESWGKVAFMWFLSPKHSIVMGLFICVFTITWCSPVIVTIMACVFHKIKGNFCFWSHYCFLENSLPMLN